MSIAAPSVTFHAGEGCPPSLDRSRLAREFVSLLAHFPKPVARIDVQLVGDAAMSAAHKRFMDIDGTTDVMSFPAHDEPGGPGRDDGVVGPVEADLILCVDYAAREVEASLRLDRKSTRLNSSHSDRSRMPSSA